MTERNNVACPVADEITIRQPQVTKLAKKYMSRELGEIDVLSENGQILFDFGERKAQWLRGRMMMGPLGSSRSTGPTNQGFEFVVGDKAGKRTLTIRDGQHEYVLQKWLEADQTPAGTDRVYTQSREYLLRSCEPALFNNNTALLTSFCGRQRNASHILKRFANVSNVEPTFLAEKECVWDIGLERGGHLDRNGHEGVTIEVEQPIVPRTGPACR